MGYSKYTEDIIDRWVEDTGPDGPGGPGGPAGPCGPASLGAIKSSYVSSLRKSCLLCRDNSVRVASRRFEFHKRGQLFIRVHNETLSFVAMCVRNPDRSPVGIHG
jgi:hypothetical protein